MNPTLMGAIFLVMKMDHPFDGLIRISPEPLRFVYSQIGR